MFIILQMCNKTIIEFGFCDMQNYQGRGKRYSRWPAALVH